MGACCRNYDNEVQLCPQLLKAFETIPILQTPDERIVSCILGVPTAAHPDAIQIDEGIYAVPAIVVRVRAR
jgi:hypothetical protein